jgi:hypothetical protein
MKSIALSGRFSRLVGSLLLSILFGLPAWSQQLSTQLQPASPEAVPALGTFRSLVLSQPPLPFNPFPELPVYMLPDGSFVYDDSLVDYLALQVEAALIEATVASFGDPQLMSMSGPPLPGGGGGGSGCGSGGSGTNPPPYSVPGLKLTIPAITNGVVFTSVFEADTNSAYDLFEQFALVPGAPWARIAGTEIGETNFAVSQFSMNAAYYRAADTTDSDFDGLPDAVETLELGLNPLLADSDSDGIPDGSEIGGNGWPHAVNYQAMSRAVIFASRGTAYENGQSGEWTIVLPALAPPGGVTVTWHVGGYTDLGMTICSRPRGCW